MQDILGFKRIPLRRTQSDEWVIYVLLLETLNKGNIDIEGWEIIFAIHYVPLSSVEQTIHFSLLWYSNHQTIPRVGITSRECCKKNLFEEFLSRAAELLSCILPSCHETLDKVWVGEKKQLPYLTGQSEISHRSLSTVPYGIYSQNKWYWRPWDLREQFWPSLLWKSLMLWITDEDRSYTRMVKGARRGVWGSTRDHPVTQSAILLFPSFFSWEVTGSM